MAVALSADGRRALQETPVVVIIDPNHFFGGRRLPYDLLLASAKRTFGLLKSHCKITDAKNPKTLQTLKCDVDFESLSFMYGNHIKVLDNINFSIKNGQT